MTHRSDSKVSGRVAPAMALGLLFAAAAALAPACKGVVAQTIVPIPPASVGEIGDPCDPHDEDSPSFAGYKVAEENIASLVKDCNSGICLANHVQGRRDCPLGQAAPTPCQGPSDASCGAGSSCVAAGLSGPWCNSVSVDGGPAELDASACISGLCNSSPRSTCRCTADAQCPVGAACDAVTQECAHFVCHRAGACQSSDATDAENAGKSCCAGGVDVPVSAEVCGQCEKGPGRRAAEGIYCSCRCGLADGAAPDGSELCACPVGFECAQIRPDVGIGDPQLTGKYCIKQGTSFAGVSQCGIVDGHLSGDCDGVAAP